MPRGELDELDQPTLLLLLLSVLCAYHVQALPRPRGCIDESLCRPMIIESIGPQMDSDCTRLTGADHTVSTSTGGEYGALSTARAAGGLEAVPMACNARICNLAAPFHQCSTHGLPGLHLFRRSGERVSHERLAGCTSDQESGLQDTWRQSPFLVRHRESERHGVSEFLRARFAAFFALANHPTHCECNASCLKYHPGRALLYIRVVIGGELVPVKKGLARAILRENSLSLAFAAW
jgi:hypothetical protein